MPSRFTPKTFIERARLVHGDDYDYSQIDFVHSIEKVPIICKVHGQFHQRPQKHLDGQGCPKCRYLKSAQSQRLPLQDFINKARAIHGNKYDYSSSEYRTSNQKVRIICPDHGIFEMTPGNHTHSKNPQGCPECGGRTKWTKELFIDEANKVHGSRYSYYKVEYVSTADAVTIICPFHGDFFQKPSKHLSGQGCPVCAGTKKKTTEQFIVSARQIHGNKYDYSEVVYTTTHKNVRIICPEHGSFEMSPSNHTHSKKPQGCPKCSGRKIFDTTDFVHYAEAKHDGYYSYADTRYVDSKTPLVITCPYHGNFLQKPSVHLMGSGCSRCRSPRGENRIETLLKRMNIQYVNQYSFSDCRYKNPLFFDFKIEVGRNLAVIEYNGEQHYRKVAKNDMFNYSETIIRDNIKRNYCVEKKIPLLEIRFDEYDSIEQILEVFVEKLRV